MNVQKRFDEWAEGRQLGTAEMRPYIFAAWCAGVNSEREACAKVCEAAEDTGDDRGIERDVATWNKATTYCVRRIKERSNAEVRRAAQEK